MDIESILETNKYNNTLRALKMHNNVMLTQKLL